MAVVFAMLASYLLSRTLVPTMVHYMLKPEVDMYRRGEHGEGGPRRVIRSSGAFTLRSIAVSSASRPLTPGCWIGRWITAPGAGGIPGLFALGSLGLVYLVGSRFLSRRSIPARSGCTCARRRARASKQTEVVFANVENEIRSVIPAGELDTMLDNIGLPNSTL